MQINVALKMVKGTRMFDTQPVTAAQAFGNIPQRKWNERKTLQIIVWYISIENHYHHTAHL